MAPEIEISEEQRKEIDNWLKNKGKVVRTIANNHLGNVAHNVNGEPLVLCLDMKLDDIDGKKSLNLHHGVLGSEKILGELKSAGLLAEAAKSANS